MESIAKSGSGGAKHNSNYSDNERGHREEEEEEEEEANPNLSCANEDGDDVEEEGDSFDDEGGGERETTSIARQSPTGIVGTPFTTLSQIDADLALARTLQEQERAYMMLRMNNEGSDYGSWEVGSYLHDDEDDFGDQSDYAHEDNGDDEHEYDESDPDGGVDAFDAHVESEFDPAEFSSDEAYARALQDAEERGMAARLLALAGIHDREAVHTEDHGGNSQDTWEEIAAGELSYEELLALGEVVGTESRGLSADTISTLSSIKYKSGSSQNGISDLCVICREDYEDVLRYPLLDTVSSGWTFILDKSKLRAKRCIRE